MTGKGLVGGVLWYFPCKDGIESIPHNAATLPAASGGGQQVEPLTSQWDGVSQQPSLTQRPLNVNGKHDWCSMPVPLLCLSLYAHCHSLPAS